MIEGATKHASTGVDYDAPAADAKLSSARQAYHVSADDARASAHHMLACRAGRRAGVIVARA